MPSGSHGGGGGSHSSGGSSSGGGSWGGSSSGGGRSHSPMYIRWRGSRYYISSGKASTIRTLFSVALFLCFFVAVCVFAVVSTNHYITKIETDRIYYIQMIEYAEEHTEYQKEGEITGRFYNEDFEKWYITYSIPYGNYQQFDLDGYTFSVYTTEDMKKPEFQVGKKLIFAVDNPDVDMFTDSINMEYKNIPLENDGEYVYNVRSRNSTIGVVCALVAIIVTLVTIAIVKIKKSVQNEDNLGKQISTILAETKANNKNNEQTEQKPKQCIYCGNYLDESDKKCPSCGSRRFKR